MAASRKNTLFIAWYRAAAARSSSESVFGYAGAISYALPTVALGDAAFTARMRLRLSKRQSVRCFQKVAEAGSARRKSARSITHEGNRPGHVKGRPHRDSIAEMLGENAGIVCEVIGQIPVRPASTIFECLRKIPVVHRAPRPYACLKQEHRRSGCRNRSPSCSGRQFR